MSVATYSLVRLVGARCVSSLFDGDDSVTMEHPVFKVVGRGTELTRVASAPAFGEWSFDEESMVLTFNGVTPIIAHSYYFFSSGQSQVHYEDPLDNATTLRQWRGRLLDEATLSKSIANQFSGFFTTATGSVTILDADRDLQASPDYMSFGTVGGDLRVAETSFFKKDLDIWAVTDGTVLKTGSASITDIRSDATKITFGYSDKALDFSAIAYMGDTSSEAYFPSSTKPCPYVFGRSAFGFDVSGLGSETQYNLSPLKCAQGFSTSTTLGNYSLCRTSSTGLKTLAFGTISTVQVLNNVDYFMYQGTQRAYLRIRTLGADNNLEVGDSFKFTDPIFVGNQYAIVMREVSGSTDEFECMILTQSPPALLSTITGTVTFTANSAPAIIIQSASNIAPYILAFEKDFTVSSTSTTFGNKIHKISTVASFNTATSAGLTGGSIHPNYTTFDPSNDRVYFRVTEATPTTALKKLIELDTEFTSTLSAASDLSSSFTVPYFDETDFGPVSGYIEDYLNCTNTYAFLNSDGEIEQGDYSTGTLGSYEIALTDKTLLEGTLEYVVEYRDMPSDISLVNVHNPSGTGLVGSNDNAYLHDLNNGGSVTQLKNLVGSTGFGALILKARSNPRYTISGAFPTELLQGLELGETITVESSQLFGGTIFLLGDTRTAVTMKVTTLKISPSRTEFQAIMILISTVTDV